MAGAARRNTAGFLRGRPVLAKFATGKRDAERFGRAAVNDGMTCGFIIHRCGYTEQRLPTYLHNHVFHPFNQRVSRCRPA
jgi:hypothetical protein